jgi:hypothetical protein
MRSKGSQVRSWHVSNEGRKGKERKGKERKGKEREDEHGI